MIEVRWTPHEPPLTPRVALLPKDGLRGAWSELRERRWTGLVSPLGLLVLAAEAGAPDRGELPWVRGASYYGRDERCPRLILPTALAPRVPLELFERAVVRRALAGFPEAVEGPILVAPGAWTGQRTTGADETHEAQGAALVVLHRATALDSARLESWLDAEGS